MVGAITVTYIQVQTPQRKLLMHYYILIDRVGGQNGKIFGSRL